MLFRKGKDVLNEAVPFPQVESELVRDSTQHLLFTFSSLTPPELIMEDQSEYITVNEQEFYNTDFKKLGETIENPLPDSFYQELTSIIG